MLFTNVLKSNYGSVYVLHIVLRTFTPVSTKEGYDNDF
jgi:hypothetical protein